MIEIYATKINSMIEESKFKKLFSYVSDERKKKINSLVRFRDRYQSLIGEILIRQIIVKNTSMQNSDIKILTNDYGKPYLDNYNKFHFNISHSGDWVVCAVDEYPIGIDIEKIEVISYSDIARRFFTMSEFELLNNKTEYESLRYFFELWTIKESYIKAVGKGLSIPLNSFEITTIGDSIESKGKNKRHYFKTFDIDDYYKLSVCSENKVFPEKIIIKSFNTIFQHTYLLERR